MPSNENDPMQPENETEEEVSDSTDLAEADGAPDEEPPPHDDDDEPSDDAPLFTPTGERPATLAIDDHPFARSDNPPMDPSSFLPAAITLLLGFGCFWSGCADEAEEPSAENDSPTTEEGAAEPGAPAGDSAQSDSTGGTTSTSQENGAQGTSSNSNTGNGTAETNTEGSGSTGGTGGSDGLLAAAQSAMDRGDHDEALRQVNLALDQSAQSAEVYELRAKIHRLRDGSRSEDAIWDDKAAARIRSGKPLTLPQ